MDGKSRVIFQNTMPSRRQLPTSCLLIYDRILLRSFRPWIRSFTFSYGVKAGEELKQLSHFPEHVTKLLKINEQMQTRDLTIIALGGGSVGDFAGFVASVFKRGVPLIQIPSTWLAAMDSAHGGKTALNAGGFKNQIGSFYPAHLTFICKSLLLSQPVERGTDAVGELHKTVLLKGGALWRKCKDSREFSARQIYQLLPDLIRYKHSIVQRDPYETKGLRLILNLGHTLGHVFEAALARSHGQAVDLGLVFALEFSKSRGHLSEKSYARIMATQFGRSLPPLPTVGECLRQVRDLERYITQDKKLSDGNIRFIFLNNVGKPIIEKTAVQEIVEFARALERKA